VGEVIYTHSCLAWEVNANGTGVGGLGNCQPGTHKSVVPGSDNRLIVD
jgi:hypothetical protein